MKGATVLVLLGGLGLTTALILVPGAAPTGSYVPRSDGEVLEQVPKSTPRPSGPLGVDEAAARARELISEARRNGGDPRLLGRAQATLNPWWNEPAPPPALRSLRATIKQQLHDFEGALLDLAEPVDAEGWLTRAQVLTTLARYSEALAACEHLDGVARAICSARIKGINGQAKEAAETLRALEPTETVLAVRGELERWSGDDLRAEADLARALSLDPADTHSRLLLADLFLDARQPERAAKLFEGRVVNDAELLVWVLALKASGAKEYDARRVELDERVAANRQRGETLYQREESRYALALEGDAAKALELAQKNWAVRKEPEDARVLLEAAAAMKDEAAAAPVRQWLEQTKFSDPRLRALVTR